MSGTGNPGGTTDQSQTPGTGQSPAASQTASGGGGASGSGSGGTAVAGILAYDEIKAEVLSGRLIKNGVEGNVQACSYDMRIGTIFRQGRIIKGQQAAGDQVLLEPGEIISVFTLEELELPDNIAATAFAINAMSSEGLLVLNPGHVDPGFKGPLTVRAINIRATRKSIDLGTPIFTVVFERLPRPTTKPYNKSTNRDEREIKFNATDVEQNPGSLSNLVMLGTTKPLMTGEEVDRRIMAHWMTWSVFIGTIITIALAAIAAVFAIIGVYKASPSQPVIVNPSPSGQTAPANTTVTPASPGNVNEQNVNSGQKAGNANAFPKNHN